MTRILTATCLLAILTMAGGCASAGLNAKWWSPATWFSGSELRSVERTEAKADVARERVLKAAQVTAHETQHALAEAPGSRAVEVATEANSQTVTLLDQAVGPLSVEETQRLISRVNLLLSENAELRKKGETERAEHRESVSKSSSQLAELQAKLSTANAKLAQGFERENALANELRNQRLILWAVGAAAVIGYAGILYLRFAYGGIPQALGKGLSTLRAKNPDAGELATTIFDGLLNRHEQSRIARHT